MHQVRIVIALFALVLVATEISADGHTGGSVRKGAIGEGSCSYVQEYRTAGPFKVCQTPANAEGCEKLGSLGQNRDASHSPKACETRFIVGTCDFGHSEIFYYSGYAEALATGCKYQGGTWIDP
jgi:hypothetical protein